MLLNIVVGQQLFLKQVNLIILKIYIEHAIYNDYGWKIIDG